MSGEAIKNFLVNLGFHIDEAGLKSFGSALNNIGVQAAIMESAVVVAAGALFGTVQHVAATYFELDKLATQFRTTAKAVDEFMDVGKILGLSEEDTVGSLKSLDKAIGETANNLGRAKMWFQATGQSVLDATGKMRPTIDVMNELAEKFKNMERGKALAIMEHLGLDPSLLKLFNADLVTLKRDIDDIETAAGFNLTDAIDQSKQFTLSWRGFTQELEKVKMLFSKMVDVIAVRLMPRFRASLDTLTGHIVGLRKIVMQNMEQIQKVIDGAINVLLRLVEFVSTAASRLIQLVTSVVGNIVSLFSQLTGPQQAVIAAFAAIALAWKLLNASFLFSPIGIIASLAAAILLLWEDFKIWKEGGESLIDWAAWEPGVTAAMEGITALRDLIWKSVKVIVDAVLSIVHVLTGDFSGAWEDVGKIVQNVVGIFQDAWKVITNIVDAIGKFASPMASLFTGGDGSSPSPSPQHAMAGGGGVLDTLTGMGKSMLGFGTQPMLTPSPAMAGGGGIVQHNSQKTEVIVQASNNPEATAKYVAREQSRVNADNARNMMGRVR